MANEAYMMSNVS